MIEPASTLDMDDDTRGRMITRCVAYMTQRKIPIRDTRAVTRLLASNAGRIDGATNVRYAATSRTRQPKRSNHWRR